MVIEYYPDNYCIFLTFCKKYAYSEYFISCRKLHHFLLSKFKVFAVVKNGQFDAAVKYIYILGK
jgi:hypothetical protein